MQTDDFDGLIALKVVAEKLSFAEAAKELGISAGRVSQVIKQLETKLGVNFLSRTTRSVSLTEAGENFLLSARPGMDQIITALQQVGGYTNTLSGTLRLNLPRLIYPNIIAPIIATFVKKYPDISIELIFDDEASDIVEGRFDAGIRLSDILIKDMVAIKVYGPARFVVAGSPAYFKMAERPKHPKDLLSQKCIILGRSKNTAYTMWDFESRGKDFQVQVKGNLLYSDGVMAIQAAIDGLGVIYTLESAISSQIKSKELEVVLQPYVASSTGFFLYYPARSQVQPKLRAFIEHLQTFLKKG